MHAAWGTDATSTRLLLTDESGATHHVDALAIFDAEFDRLSLVNGLSVTRPSEDLPDLLFSPQLASANLELQTTADGAVLRMILSATGERLPRWPVRGQLIVGGVWHAFDPLEVERAERRLGSHAISIDAPLNAREVLWLLWESALDVKAAPTDPRNALAGSSRDASDKFDPTLVRAGFYSYQVQGACFLAEAYDLGLGTLLADEMGLGKTMQALYLLAYAARSSSKPNLVVAPSSTIANWQRELARFAPGVSVRQHTGSRRTGDPNVLSQANVVLTSYDVIVRDRSLFEEVGWNVVALDEAQLIKNSQAQRSAAVKALKKTVGLGISGTPIENSLSDMWSIFEFVASEFLGSESAFTAQYPDSVDAARALSMRVSPMVIRRSIEMVASDLPPRVDIVTPLYVSDRLATAYEDARAEISHMALAKLTRLRQLCSVPSSVDSNWKALTSDFPKWDRLEEILDEATLHNAKVLIFAPFTDAIDQIEAAISARYSGVFLASVDGRVSSLKRQEIIDSFSNFEGAGVLVMNPRAAGVGLNIQAATYVVHFSPEWNPAVISQASARAHRRGQTRPVFVYYLYYLETVEEMMIDRLNSKRELQQAGLTDASQAPDSSDIAMALKFSPRRT